MRKQLALETGSPEPRAAAPTFAEFVETKFRPLHLKVKCHPATIERYEYLLKQGILRELVGPALKSKLPTARVVLTRNETTPRRTHVLTALKHLEKKLGTRAWSFDALRHF